MTAYDVEERAINIQNNLANVNNKAGIIILQ